AQTHYRRNGIHVLRNRATVRPLVQAIPCGDGTPADVVDLAFGLRQARLEIPNCDGMGRRADKLFLAAGGQCELGPRAFLPRTTRCARIALSFGLPARRSVDGVFPDPPGIAVVDKPPEATLALSGW